MNSFYEITHSNPEILTLGDYILDPICPLIKTKEQNGNSFDVQNAAKSLLSWSKDGKTNQTRIIEKYNAFEQEEFVNLDDDGNFLSFKVKENNLLFKIGTKLAIPDDQIDRYSLLTEGIKVASVDESTFKAEKLAELEADVGYVSVLRPNKGNIQLGTLKSTNPQITVWMWCRALSKDREMKGQLVDLTPFIQRVSTSVTKTGGNFQLTLAPLVCEYSKEGEGWVLKKNSVKKAISIASGKQEFISEESLFKLQNDRLVRNEFLFHRIITPNDLVFIRYETLKLEENQRYEDSLNFNISKNNIPGRIYDMIGLVDSNTFSLSPDTNDVSIQVVGRDLSKLFIEDGAYFYALEQSQGKVYLGGGASQKDPLTQRVFFDGGLQAAYLSLYFYNPIQKILQFIIQQLATISIVPNDFFEAYGDNRNSSFASSKSIDQLKVDNDSSEKEAKARIRSLRKSNSISSNNTVDESNQVNLIYRNLKQFLLNIRKGSPAFRIVNGNTTYGWRRHYSGNEIVEQNILPTVFNDKLKIQSAGVGIAIQKEPEIKSIIDNIDQIIEKEKSSTKVVNPMREKPANGIFQIIELVLDKSISNRRIVDSSISTASGSLLNFIRKACQEPLVEYYMDTIGDKFYLIARRPPHNREGVISLLEGQVQNEKNSKITSGTIDIGDEDVIRETLAFDDLQAYSWYRYIPQGSFLGGSSNYSTAYIPALYFPEYAEIWGSRPLEVVSNYFTYLPLDKKSTELNEIEKQAFIDLKYLVESNAHLPFTRKGSLVVNRDRRLKIGNLIRYKPTGEIFLIEAVQHQHSVGENNNIEATTTLQVSRGMIEQLIYGVVLNDSDGNRVLASYFNIVDTNLDFTTKTVKEEREIQKKNPNYKPQKNASVTEKHDPDTTREINTESQFSAKGLSAEIVLAISKINVGVQRRFTELFLGFQRLGYSVIIDNPKGLYTTKRSPETQVKLILKHRNKGWYSQEAIRAAERGDFAYMQRFPHVKGIALDINIKNIKTGRHYTSRNTSADWVATGCPKLAASLGFRWGGTFNDPVHFEYIGKVQTINESVSNNSNEQEYISEKVEEYKQVIDSSNVTKNIKVNRDVFNFFLQQRQFNYNVDTVSKIQAFGTKNKEDIYEVDLNEVNIGAKKIR